MRIMNEIARHIETLLLENDCVIVPDFGGFVAHYTAAEWKGQEQVFYPPGRVIGFNPKLQINDGVLAQSYMKSYHTTFSDAITIIEAHVRELTGSLATQGKAELPNIGEIRCTLEGVYNFVAYNHRIITPAFYGLDAFGIKELRAIQREANSPRATNRKPRRGINFALLRNASVAAAAVALFFLLSPPIDNTYMGRYDTASMLPSDLWKQIEQHSLLINPIACGSIAASEDTPLPGTSEEAQPAAAPVSGETVHSGEEPAEATLETPAAAPAKPQRMYHIIVASVNREKEAGAIIQQLHAEGHNEAKVLASDDKIRVSIKAYPTQEEAMEQLRALWRTEAHADAWLLRK